MEKTLEKTLRFQQKCFACMKLKISNHGRNANLNTFLNNF